MDNINELIDSAAQYLNRLAPGVIGLADEARFALHIDIERIRDIYEGIGWMMEAIASIPFADLGLVPIEAHEGTMTKHLKELLSSYERSDYVYLADILEYEIYPVICGWMEAF